MAPSALVARPAPVAATRGAATRGAPRRKINTNVAMAAVGTPAMGGAAGAAHALSGSGYTGTLRASSQVLALRASTTRKARRGALTAAAASAGGRHAVRSRPFARNLVVTVTRLTLGIQSAGEKPI